MSRKIPISIRKLVELNNSRRLSNYVREEYLIQINEKQNNWEISKIFDREELLTLRNEINEILGLKTASEKLNCSIEEVEKLQEYHKQNKICENFKCKYLLISYWWW